MAIGLFGSKATNENRPSTSDDDKFSSHEKDPELARIESPARRDMDDSDASMTVGKQMELEAENAIKYRTCSWQKVGLDFRPFT